MRCLNIFILIFPIIAFGSQPESYDFGVSPNDYLFRDRGLRHDQVFDQFRKIELGVDLSGGADCGKLDMKGTLKSTVDKVLDPSLFGNALEGIAAGAPLLTICYFSPTWCALAKHFRVNAQAMTDLRFNQCAVMDKYVDSRVEDYYNERQNCLHRELQNSGGNQEEAVSKCGGNGLYEQNIANWAGDKFGGKVKTNKLIDSSAKWAGFDGPNAKQAVELVKSFVGETTISGGQVSVEYGPRQVALSPTEHLVALKKQVLDRLCGDMLGRLRSRPLADVYSSVTDSQLKSLTDSEVQYVDQQTVYYLMRLPPERRYIYCEKLAASVAVSKFSEDVTRSLQILNELAQNPNLPESRKKELQDKRRAFKEAVEITVELQKEQNAPVNQITSQINQEGQLAEASSTVRAMQIDQSQVDYRQLKNQFYDCSDSAVCDPRKSGGH